MSARARQFAMGFALLMLCGGCGRQEDKAAAPRKPTAPANRAAPAPTAAQPAAEPAKQARTTGRVFVDISGSMKGFALADPMRIETLHRIVGESLARDDVTPVDVCEVGAAAAPTCDLALAPIKYRSASAYRASASRVAAALAPVREDAEVAANNARPVSALDGRDIAVVITDGLESNSASGDKGATAIVAGCRPGLDVHCLERVLATRAAAGYGLWLIPLSLPFKGKIYAERGLDAALFERVKQHVVALREDPKWAAANPGVGKLASRTKSGMANYVYTGPRPLLIIVMARAGAVGVGRKVATRIAASLTAKALPQPTGRSRLLDLAPGKSAVWTFGPKLDHKVRPADAVVRAYPGKRVRGKGQTFALECDRRAGVALSLSAALRRPAEPPLPSGLSVRTSVALVGAEAMLRQHAVTPLRKDSAGAKQGRWSLGLSCLDLRQAANTVTVELRGQVAHTRATSGRWWWNDWHAASSWEQPERLYMFGDLVEALLATRATPAKLQDRLVLSVKRLD